ncbi:hypothetical protein D3C80_1580390 [compost metagenome]
MRSVDWRRRAGHCLCHRCGRLRSGRTFARYRRGALGPRRPVVQQRRRDADRLLLGNQRAAMAAHARCQPAGRHQRYPCVRPAVAAARATGPCDQHRLACRVGQQPLDGAIQRDQAGSRRALGNTALRIGHGGSSGIGLGTVPGPGGQRNHGLEPDGGRGRLILQPVARQQHSPGDDAPRAGRTGVRRH